MEGIMSTIPKRLERSRAILVVIDVQELFRPLIHDMNMVVSNSSRLMRYCDRLDIPVIVSEHYPAKLGSTVAELAELSSGQDPVEKISFSCAGDSGFLSRLQSTRRDQVILCGIETHVCVYQTARDLLSDGYQVVTAADAVSSRQVSNRNLGLAYMRDLGVQTMTTEMVMFEMLKMAGTEEFKSVADILKENPR
jgi:nicotinamidase-related amidase